ncbi:MAG: tetratricopeptide repeat protein [Bacteroidales bacterium]
MKALVLAILIGSITISAVYSQDNESKYGSDSVKCVMNNSLYYEFFMQWKQSNYKNTSWKDAYTPWRWVFINCPASTKNIYLHGEKLIDEKIKNETDKNKKEKYIDTLMMVYDKRIKYFGNEGYVFGKKGSDLYKLRPSAYEESYNLLKQSIKLEGNSSDGSVLIYYFRTAEKMVKEGKAEKFILVDIYDETSVIVEYNIKEYTEKGDDKKVKNWENVKGNIELSFEPYATCEDLISLYTVKFNENPENIELLRKIVKILDKKNCTDSELFIKALEKLVSIEPEPSASSYELLGKLYIKREQFDEASKFLQQAIDLEKDNNERADVHYLLANVYFQQKKYTQARANCYEVIKIRPEDGKAYILIGDMYAANAKDCGDNDLTTKVAYWAAVDKYIKARNVDPSISELATTKINTFSQYFPQTETIFFYDLKKGDSYIVGCWINETTTVRTSD